MFDASLVAQIANDHKASLKLLGQVEEELNSRFFDMRLPIRALILAVASGEPLLLVGPPGTAKSKLVRAFCQITGILSNKSGNHDASVSVSANRPSQATVDDGSPDQSDVSLRAREAHGQSRQGDGYFEYLLTPFTEPGELFGFFDIAKLHHDREFTRISDNMMQKAKVVYLDEVFNGSSAILNSILTFLQEKTFHDRGVHEKVAYEVLFGATNSVPETPELRAVFDRFVIRCRVTNVAPNREKIGRLLEDGWTETFDNRKTGVVNADTLLHRMTAFRLSVQSLTVQRVEGRESTWNDFLGHLAVFVQHTRQYELSEMSNRRLVKMCYVMIINRIYEAVMSNDLEHALTLRPQELQLIPDYFLDRWDDEEAIRQLNFQAANAEL